MSTIAVNNITDTGGSTLLGRRNAIINGNFDVWQRGTSQTADGYLSVDRWRLTINATTQSVTQQAFTLGQTDVPYNPKYYLRDVVTTASTAGSYAILQQNIEGVESFAGETVTLSFYAKADASKNIAVEFVQSFGSGGSPSTVVTGISVTTVALTTSWAKYTVTADIPSITGKTLGTDGNDYLRVQIWLEAGSDFNARTNSLGNQSGTFEFAQVQLEAGSVATPFERRSVGEELALCQRYYSEGTIRCVTSVYETNFAFLTPIFYPVVMRDVPTITATPVELRFDGGTNATATLSGNQINNRMSGVIASAISVGGTYNNNGYGAYTYTADAEL